MKTIPPWSGVGREIARWREHWRLRRRQPRPSALPFGATETPFDPTQWSDTEWSDTQAEALALSAPIDTKPPEIDQ
jgi:hypothetical protein